MDSWPVPLFALLPHILGRPRAGSGQAPVVLAFGLPLYTSLAPISRTEKLCCSQGGCTNLWPVPLTQVPEHCRGMHMLGLIPGHEWAPMDDDVVIPWSSPEHTGAMSGTHACMVSDPSYKRDLWALMKEFLGAT